MNIDAAKAMREIVAGMPSSTAVLEELGLDYCCGGDRSLEDACRQRGLSVEEVVGMIEANERSSHRHGRGARDWNAAPLAELISYIVNKHHQFTRQALNEGRTLLPRVCAKHGDNHPELRMVESTFQDLDGELTAHMFKEEQVLFPYIAELEDGHRNNRPVSRPPFGTVENPVRVMICEHDSAGEKLKKIRETTGDYVTPPDACTSYQALYRTLRALEEDLHHHIYLENYVLFPRAVEMEEAGGRAKGAPGRG